MKYAWIDCIRVHWPLSALCDQLHASVSGYHQHALRLATNDGRKTGSNHISDDALLAHVKALHVQSMEKMAGHASGRNFWPVASVSVRNGYARS